MSRRKRMLITAVLLLAATVVAGAAGPAFGAEPGGVVSTADLIEKSKTYDGREVVYRGEAVGDILNRGGGAWVTVNDDHYSKKPLRISENLKGGNSGIGVYGPREDIDRISFLGSYTARGDFVEVRGVFYLTSVEHGGDTCIVARSVRVLERGHPLPEDGARTELVAGAVLLVVCGLLAAVVLERRRRRA